MMRRKKP
jgi:hypothetical protein